ncbi:LacI family DNA-binding transcriptional regulator [Dictyobacter arantiisoli]|uniref:LacI family transcriptional regulator n=1 Tax=Dictyobacter arantiisoli TaxID=2014874 RepID=A0A5A5TE69_9CHLR|nr:LacI family DNA-binding transcriptional regulator [Dictyobacter arantiisoli]GCF09850.1 LacI family transcriptional regulator [Dictyobacter arantiisoli]
MHSTLTIQDIARLAGVSKATVSRVLNHNPSVNALLRERVQHVIQEYDFVPSVTAIGLAGGRTRLIGVLAPPLTWPSVPEIMHGIAEYLECTDYEMVLYSIGFERNHSDVLDHILNMKMVAGLLAIFPGELSNHLAQRFQQGFPLVTIDDQSKPSALPWVGINTMTGAYEATRHLLELGHRRIAHILGPQHYYCAVERYQGYCQALQDAGIALNPNLLFQGTFTPASGRQCATMLFSRERQDWPTAIFVANDQMAYGVLEVAEQQGISVPEEIAVVGFDDNMLSAHLRPSLTTIQQPFSEMGRQAIEALIMSIDQNHSMEQGRLKQSTQSGSEHVREDPQTTNPLRIQVPTRLIVRASSGSPRTLPIG